MAGYSQGLSASDLTVSIASDNTDLVLDALDRQILAGLERIGERARDHAREEVPYRTGNLHDSIGYSVSSSDKTVTVGTDVHYASYVELGTWKMPARPYLRPAIVNHTAEYRAILENALQNG